MLIFTKLYFHFWKTKNKKQIDINFQWDAEVVLCYRSVPVLVVLVLVVAVVVAVVVDVIVVIVVVVVGLSKPLIPFWG